VVIIVIEAKVDISISFSIAKLLVVCVIRASIIVVKGGPPLLLLLLLNVNQLCKPASCGEEEKQD
jgi:hypothetical protein